MAARLRANLASYSELEVAEYFFEDYTACGRVFRVIASANAFHWVDPAVSYVKAAALLEPAGSLVLCWMFPIVADEEIQRRLNDEVFADELAQMARDPDQFVDQLHELSADGRAEVVASGCFQEPWWALYEERLDLSVDDYVHFLNSRRWHRRRRAPPSSRP